MISVVGIITNLNHCGTDPTPMNTRISSTTPLPSPVSLSAPNLLHNRTTGEREGATERERVVDVRGQIKGASCRRKGGNRERCRIDGKRIGKGKRRGYWEMNGLDETLREKDRRGGEDNNDEVEVRKEERNTLNVNFNSSQL